MPNVYRQKALIKIYEKMRRRRRPWYLLTKTPCAHYFGVSINIDRTGKVHNLRKNLRFAAVCSHARPKRNAKRYFALKRRNKKGEPMYKRFGLWRMVIYPGDIVNLLGIRMRTAQEMLQNTRFLLGKPPGSYVALKDFCNIHDLKEDLVREVLNKRDKILIDKQKEIDEQKRLEKQKEKEEKKKEGIIAEVEQQDDEEDEIEEEEEKGEDEFEKEDKLKKAELERKKRKKREKRTKKMIRKKNLTKRISLKKMTITKKRKR